MSGEAGPSAAKERRPTAELQHAIEELSLGPIPHPAEERDPPTSTTQADGTPAPG